MTNEEILETPSRCMAQFVSIYVGTLAETDLYFEKKIVIKENILNNLKNRITEILKFEDSKRVIFGVFTTALNPKDVCDAFEDTVKNLIKKKSKKEVNGGVWCVEINGSSRGLGVIAADDKIKTWRDVRS